MDLAWTAISTPENAASFVELNTRSLHFVSVLFLSSRNAAFVTSVLVLPSSASNRVSAAARDFSRSFRISSISSRNAAFSPCKVLSAECNDQSLELALVSKSMELVSVNAL